MTGDRHASSFGDPARRAALAIPLAIVLFFALNVIVGVLGRSSRGDLTQDRLYTLSDVTRKTLAALDEPVTLRLYRSPGLVAAAPRLKIYAERVDEMLRTYRELSRGKVIYEVVEPEPFSPEEDRAIGYRLRGFNVDRSGAQGYFGLVGVNTLDGLERVEFLDPQREDSLEYDLTSIVRRLSQTRKPVIGILESLNMFGSQQLRRPPWAILDIINKAYSVRPVATGASMSLDGVDLLLVVHPRGLAPRDLFAIDQFALSGKPVLVFVDPVYDAAASQAQQRPPLEMVSSNLGPLFDAWGVSMPADKVAGDRGMALRVTGMAGRQRVVASYLPWLQVREANFNREDMATARLKLMRITSAGALSAKAGATTKFSPLISTTGEAMLLDANEVLGRPNPNVFLEKFKAGATPLALAARISGPANTAYPEGQPPAAEGAEANSAPAPATIVKSTNALHVAVVGDVDLLGDDHMVNGAGQFISNNADFVLNLVETLAGGADLAGLRGRGMTLRTFTRVEDMEKAAENLYHAREAALTADLEKSQQELQQMVARGAAEAGEVLTLTREQQDLLGKLNQKIVDLRRQLRDVRAAVRADIDALETRLKLVNILAVPVGLIVLGLLISLWRRARLSRYVAARKAGVHA